MSSEVGMNANIQTVFPMNPDKKGEVLEVIKKEFAAMAENISYLNFKYTLLQILFFRIKNNNAVVALSVHLFHEVLHIGGSDGVDGLHWGQCQAPRI